MREDVRRPYRSAILRRKKREEEDEAGTALVPLGSRGNVAGLAPDASTQAEAVLAEVEDALAAQTAELGGKRGAVRRAQDMADIFFRSTVFATDFLRPFG